MNEQQKRITRNYRIAQFLKIDTEYEGYKTKIKLIKPNGETNWIDIENHELDRIKTILTA